MQNHILTSRARPLVSIGIRKFPRAQSTQATANGQRARITDWDISTWSTHRAMIDWTKNLKSLIIKQDSKRTWAMNGAIIPPIRLNDVQKPIPRERATVGYTWETKTPVTSDPVLKKMHRRRLWTYLCRVDVNHIKVHGDQRPQQKQQHREAKPARPKQTRWHHKPGPALMRWHHKPGPGQRGLWGSYIVEQMLSIIKKKAASSCSTVRVILRPNTLSRAMFAGTTGRTEERSQSRPDPGAAQQQTFTSHFGNYSAVWLKNWWTENSLDAFRWRWLTCDLSKAADKQSLVVTVPKGDAVTQSVLMAMFDLMLFIGIDHTQQVLLQQLWTAQHWAVVYKRCHKPDSETNESWSWTGPRRIIHTGYNNHIQWLLQTTDVFMVGEKKLLGAF